MIGDMRESIIELEVVDVKVDTTAGVGEVVLDGVNVGRIARHITVKSQVGDLTKVELTIIDPPPALLLKTLVAIAEGKLTEVPLK